MDERTSLTIADADSAQLPSPLGRIREYYGVPAWPGRRVVVNGDPGVITGVQPGQMRLMVRFAGGVYPCHPTWRVEYVEEAGQ